METRPTERIDTAALDLEGSPENSREATILEIFLVLTVIGLTALLHVVPSQKMVILNMFFLPVVLSAFFLGRYRAGVLALVSIIAASVVTVLDIGGFTTMASPMLIGFGVSMWAAILGLTALLVGTLSDERLARLVELNEAYVGVIEVLSRYLQSADRKLRARSIRVAELSQKVGSEMKLSPKALDDIRVAALLHDIENLEITAKVIQKAVGSLGESDFGGHFEQHTFHGTDLAHSLGSVLTGAFPLLLKQNDSVLLTDSPNGETLAASDTPLGARIIRAVRAYDLLVASDTDSCGEESGMLPNEAIDILRRDTAVGYDAAVLDALQTAVAFERTPRGANQLIGV